MNVSFPSLTHLKLIRHSIDVIKKLLHPSVILHADIVLYLFELINLYQELKFLAL